MCLLKAPKIVAPSQAVVTASTTNPQALQAQTLEQVQRRARNGVAGNILTSPVGIPYTSTLGGVA